jgi:hypothetical protein
VESPMRSQMTCECGKPKRTERERDIAAALFLADEDLRRITDDFARRQISGLEFQRRAEELRELAEAAAHNLIEQGVA